MKRVIIITGVTSGLGKAMALHLAAMGHIVYGSSRREHFVLSGVHTVYADVRSDESVQAFTNLVVAKEGRIDVLINNAGIGIAGSVEDCSMEEVQLQMDTNFLGAVRMCKAVLPQMRRQNSGMIINICSLAGITPLPFQAFYCAGKGAVEGFGKALRFEVKPWNINIVNIQPGDFKTDFTQNRQFAKKALQADSVYLNQFCKTFDEYEKYEHNGLNPEILAKRIAKIVVSRRPRLTYYVGTVDQLFSVVLKKTLPARLYNAIIASYCKMEKHPPHCDPQAFLNKRQKEFELHKKQQQTQST